VGRRLAPRGGPPEAGEARGGMKRVEGLVGPFEVGSSRVWRRRPTRLGVKGGAFVILGEAEGR
jgi:hypothetical protein